MATEKQICANRLNALKSTGPRTPDGKARSSQNATRHGLLARRLVLRTEDLSQFQELADGFHDDIQPDGVAETNLVDIMVAARWRMLRVANLETAALDLQYEQFRSDPASALPPEATVDMRASHVWQALCKPPASLDFMGRSEARLQRQFDSAFDRLCRLRQNRHPQNCDTNPIPNTPYPEPTA
jgi:hypothetical protein